MTAENKTHTAVYFLRANTILQSPQTSGTQKVLHFPQTFQKQWLSSLTFLNKNKYVKEYTDKIHKSEHRNCKKTKTIYYKL